MSSTALGIYITVILVLTMFIFLDCVGCISIDNIRNDIQVNTEQSDGGEY